jgi:hypothetical protein
MSKAFSEDACKIKVASESKINNDSHIKDITEDYQDFRLFDILWLICSSLGNFIVVFGSSLYSFHCALNHLLSKSKMDRQKNV